MFMEAMLERSEGRKGGGRGVEEEECRSGERWHEKRKEGMV